MGAKINTMASPKRPVRRSLASKAKRKEAPCPILPRYTIVEFTPDNYPEYPEFDLPCFNKKKLPKEASGNALTRLPFLDLVDMSVSDIMHVGLGMPPLTCFFCGRAKPVDYAALDGGATPVTSAQRPKSAPKAQPPAPVPARSFLLKLLLARRSARLAVKYHSAYH